MSGWDKLISRLYTLDRSLRFEELEKILIRLGYRESQPSGGSSHFVFRKSDRRTITIPKHNPIKPVYINIVKDAAERELR